MRLYELIEALLSGEEEVLESLTPVSPSVLLVATGDDVVGVALAHEIFLVSVLRHFHVGFSVVFEE